MGDLVTIAVGGAVAGSIYLLIKKINQCMSTIDREKVVIYKVRDDIRFKRQHASKLKKLLMTAHDRAFDAWVELKKAAKEISIAVTKIIKAIQSKAYRGQQLRNLKATKKKLIQEQRKATMMKRRAHNKWDQLRNEYLSAKRNLSALY